jgi:hypothetical protein
MRCTLRSRPVSTEQSEALQIMDFERLLDEPVFGAIRLVAVTPDVTPR